VNICMCGVQDGYPHDRDCPYPLYRADSVQEQCWLDAYDAEREAEPSMLSPLRGENNNA